MKAASIPKGLDKDGKQFDQLTDFLATPDGGRFMDGLDRGWKEAMEAAERHGFISQAYGGVAVLATHAALREQVGLQGVADRMRTCNVDVPAAPSREGVSLREFIDFRTAVVDALHEHPEWRKTKARPYDLAETVVPDSAEARAYWRIRNGTKNLARKQANVDEEASVRLGGAYDPRGRDQTMLDDRDSSLVAKWRREFEEILGKSPATPGEGPKAGDADRCPECGSLDVEAVGEEFGLSEDGRQQYTVQSKCAACGARFEDVFSLSERRPLA